MNVMKEIQRINERELELNVSDSGSWHHEYRHSAYIFIGNLDHSLTEGDIIAVFSQYGEVVDMLLVRDKHTGKSLGFGFLAYEDQRSTVLAIDNMNGYKLLNRMLRVDHADKFRRPKAGEKSSRNGNREEEQFQQFAPEDDEAYDDRRKKIWNYEAYGVTDTLRPKSSTAASVVAASNAAASAAAAAITSQLTADGATIVVPDFVNSASAPTQDSKEDAKHSNRVLAMLKEKQKARDKQSQQEATGAATGAGAAASNQGVTVGLDGQTRFGDQIIPSRSSTSNNATSSSSSSRRHDRSSRSRSRSRDRNRSSHRRSSRSRSHDRDHRSKDSDRHRDRDRERERERDKDRDRDRDRHRDRSRSRDRR